MTDKRGLYVEGPRLARLYEAGRVVTFDHGKISVEVVKPGATASLGGDSSGYPRADEALESGRWG
jgi:hypothetical protein